MARSGRRFGFSGSGCFIRIFLDDLVVFDNCVMGFIKEVEKEMELRHDDQDDLQRFYHYIFEEAAMADDTPYFRLNT